MNLAEETSRKGAACGATVHIKVEALPLAPTEVENPLGANLIGRHFML